MASAIAANRLELLQIADAVARDKSIDKQVVLAAMEEAMQRAAAIPTPRLATSSPRPCRPWISTASMPRMPSR